MTTREATYAAFDRSFFSVSAYAISKGADQVGRVVFKTGGAVRAFVQLWGSDMTIGQAGGGGYDRATAAVEAAAIKLHKTATPSDPERAAMRVQIIAAMIDPAADERRWADRLERLGYTVTTIID